jgi:hypothetical protein
LRIADHVAFRRGASNVYQAEDYRRRAEECARLANQARDDLIQRDLLKLRQTYLQIAERLRRLEEQGDGR